MNHKAFGEWVRNQRLIRDLKQDELAKVSSLSRITIGNIERGENSSPDTRKKIRRALETVDVPDGVQEIAGSAQC